MCMVPLVTEFYGTVVGRHPSISVNESGDRYQEAEMFEIDISSYKPISYAPFSGQKESNVIISPKARVQFSIYTFEPGYDYAEIEKTINSLTVGTEIAFRVRSCEKVDPINKKVGFTITSIRVICNERKDLDDYLFAFHESQGYL